MKLKHADVKQAIEVRDEDAEIYLSQGWVDASKKTSDKDSDDK